MMRGASHNASSRRRCNDTSCIQLISSAYLVSREQRMSTKVWCGSVAVIIGNCGSCWLMSKVVMNCWRCSRLYTSADTARRVLSVMDESVRCVAACVISPECFPPAVSSHFPSLELRHIACQAPMHPSKPLYVILGSRLLAKLSQARVTRISEHMHAPASRARECLGSI